MHGTWDSLHGKVLSKSVKVNIHCLGDTKELETSGPWEGMETV